MRDHKKMKICILLILVMALAAVVETVFAQFWNRLPGAGILIGISGAAIFIFLTKGVMYKLLHRPEDYYKEDE